MAGSLFVALAVVCVARDLPAAGVPDLLRETLRQQSAAERSSCNGVQRTIRSGTDAAIVVRTAVELGYNSCQVIRCALGTNSGDDQRVRCESIIRGAVAAGVQPDVITRCSSDVCNPDTVAAILTATLLEPNYCYFVARPVVAPAPPPPLEPVFDRSYLVPQASAFTF